MDNQPPAPDIAVRHPLEYYIGRTKKYALAMGLFGIKIDEESRWRLATTLQLAQAIDDHIDVADTDERQIRTAEVTNFLNDSQRVAAQFPQIDPVLMGDHTYDFFRRTGLKVVHLNEPIKTAPTLRRHLMLRRLECRYYAGILTAVLSSDTRAQPRFTEAARYLSAAAEFGNVRDTLIDIRQDYANKEHQFAPTLGNRLQIIAYMGVTLMRAWHNSNRALLLPVDPSLSPGPVKCNRRTAKQWRKPPV